jgi:hypothetical protein
MSELSLEALDLCYAIKQLPQSEQTDSILNMAMALHRKIAEQGAMVTAPIFIPQGASGGCPKCGGTKPTCCKCPPDPLPLRETQRTPLNINQLGVQVFLSVDVY